jgi:phosphatidylserine/phosphatidylglycerophosphate/cardiolipin synthase-like enzyme
MPDEGNSRAERRPILEEGRTCWRVAQAERLAVVVDGEHYFRVLLEAFRHAHSRIMILGWDFAPRVRLDPADPQTELRQLLPALVEACPTLEVCILVWDTAPLYGPSPVTAPLIDRDWQSHPRIHFRFDSFHPTGASHHQKVVCVDDVLAFVGGIDLTVGRWDTPRHEVAHPLRVDAGGAPCPPVHDVQMAVSGAAAGAIAELARERWTDAGGDALAPCRAGRLPWPNALEPWPAGAPVGIARTRPRMEERAAATEVGELDVAALAAARSCIYLETQYFSSSRIADCLAGILERASPPEIVMLVWGESTGWLERLVMGENRDRILRRLARADHAGRLRVYTRLARGDGEVEVSMHAKVVVVDDVFLRVGSSNLNNRSLGLDSECDLAVEAADEATRAAIAGVRASLLAEHLARAPAEVRSAVASHGLIGAVESLNARGGLLRAYRVAADDGPQEPILGTALLDPDEPLDLEALRRRLAS